MCVCVAAVYSRQLEVAVAQDFLVIQNQPEKRHHPCFTKSKTKNKMFHLERQVIITTESTGGGYANGAC